MRRDAMRCDVLLLRPARGSSSATFISDSAGGRGGGGKLRGDYVIDQIKLRLNPRTTMEK